MVVMRANLSIEFLFSFLLFLTLISFFIFVLSHEIKNSLFYLNLWKEKIAMEEFARALDYASIIRGEKFFLPPKNYTLGKFEKANAIISYYKNEEIASYTIFGVVESNEEPI